MLESCLCTASIDRWSNKPLTGDVDVDEDVDEDHKDPKDLDDLDDHDEQHQLLSSLVETQ